MKSLLNEEAPGAGVRESSPAIAKAEATGLALPAPPSSPVFGCPHDYLDNRFVYAVISSCARGLSLVVNMNPDQRGSFDRVQCDNSNGPARESRLDVPVMITELERTLALVHSGGLRERPRYQRVPPVLLELRQVTLSGDGEPTLCPNFVEAVEAVVHLRARCRFPFFKLVLVTDATGLDRPEVAEALGLFTLRDEVWARLKTSPQECLDRVNQPDCPPGKILANILRLARCRPIVIQSLFSAINGKGPSALEIEACAQQLRELQEAGAQITLVQICSTPQPTAHPERRHLPLPALSIIAQRVREVCGLKAELF